MKYFAVLGAALGFTLSASAAAGALACEASIREGAKSRSESFRVDALQEVALKGRNAHERIALKQEPDGFVRFEVRSFFASAAESYIVDSVRCNSVLNCSASRTTSPGKTKTVSAVQAMTMQSTTSESLARVRDQVVFKYSAGVPQFEFEYFDGDGEAGAPAAIEVKCAQ